MPGALTTSRDGAITTVRFDKPPRNFIDVAVVDELYELVHKLERDPRVRCVIFAGASPGAWFTHFDPRQILAGVRRSRLRLSYRQARVLTGVVAALVRLPGMDRVLRRAGLAGVVAILRLERILRALAASDKVYIAAVDGIVFGMGAALALGCDVRVGARDMTALGLPETAIGFSPTGAVAALARTAGPSRAIDLLLEGRWLPAERAVEAGLLHRAVERERLLDEARDTAERLAARSPHLVREVKRVIHAGPTRAGARWAVEHAGFLATSATPFSEAALTAFVEDLAAAPAGPEGLLEAWRRAQSRAVG